MRFLLKFIEITKMYLPAANYITKYAKPWKVINFRVQLMVIDVGAWTNMPRAILDHIYIAVHG